MSANDEHFTGLGRLIAGTAYELEPPLSKVIASVGAALEALARGEVAGCADVLREALESAKHARDTVCGLKAFTRAEDDVPAELDVHEAIELALELTGGVVRDRAVLVRQYAQVPRVTGSLARLAHVFVALLRNAADSVPPGVRHENSIAIRTSFEAGTVVVEVTDSGMGVEPEDLPYVFEPFFEAAGRSVLSSNALAAALATVRDMGGTLAIESIAHRGSRFVMTLPTIDTRSERGDRFFLEDAPVVRRVLCVSESPADSLRCGDILAESDVRVVYATCAEALEALALAEPYDLVLCDAHTAPASRRDFRAALRRLAPATLTRTFDVRVRPSRSGVFPRTEAPVVSKTARGS